MSENNIRATIEESLSRLQQKATERVSHEPDSLTSATSASASREGTEARTTPETSQFDFDLAEFPWCRFSKNRQGDCDPKEPLVYTDTIRGKNGEIVPRTFRTYPSRWGFPGATTFALVYDLLQLWGEYGFTGTKIEFGTIRHLFMRRGERREPSVRDYNRIRRDLDILCGTQFDAENAYYDRERNCYVDLRQWSLFTGAVYFKPRHDSPLQWELPYCFVEVSSHFQRIAKQRGFFALGFQSNLFYRMRPLEQRLAIYLSRKFISQRKHWRLVPDLAQALPIEAKEPKHVRATLKRTAERLLELELPILEDFNLEKNEQGNWIATFWRNKKPTTAHPTRMFSLSLLDDETRCLIEDIYQFTGNQDDQPWWVMCARTLGRTQIHRAISTARDFAQNNSIKNKSALLTKILKDIAVEQGAVIQ